MLDSLRSSSRMPTPAISTHRVQFGVFELDLQRMELRKQGVKIKLQDQPLKLLQVLLENPGQIVSREELRERIWPANTFVEFDRGLYSAMARLRDALGDPSENPVFIETVARRGYRFVAPVRVPESVAPTAQTTRNPAITIRRFALSLLAGLLGGALLIGALLIFGGVGIRHWLEGHRSLPITQKRLTDFDTIVVGDFVNSTGDPVFDGTLREGLSVQLEQSPFLSLVSEEGIHQTLRMMGQPAKARLIPEVTREVCQRTNSTAALNGSIALIGTRYNLIVNAVNCANGDLLTSAEAQADDKSHVLDALSKAAAEMRTKLGESLKTVQGYNTPLEQATTSSLEALQAYSLGVRAEGAGDLAGAVAFFERATQIDQNFAMAYSYLAGTYEALGEAALVAENSRKAFALRDRVSALEKLIIEEEYAGLMTGDLMKVREICGIGLRTYPRSPIFHEDLGYVLGPLGEYESALEEFREAVRLAPYRGLLFRGIVHSYLYLNRTEEAEAAANQAHAKGLQANLTDVLYLLAFYRQDAAEMAREAARVRDVAGEHDLILALQADTAAYFGKIREAREFSRRASDFADQVRLREMAPTYRAVAAFREALFGNAVTSQKQIAALYEHVSGRDLDYAMALAFTYAGHAEPAEALADHLGKRFPDDTLIQLNYMPTLHARLALLRANPQEALHALEVASPYELGMPAAGFYNWPSLYPVYVRGEAYLAAHQGREAAAEFQKILDHRGIVVNEPIGALAHLQLGRAYALQEDVVKARAAYQDFLTLWKDADPDIPVLKQAKAEYAKLQ
jgi:eukaryotic-like serine/threonine-protein kinase